MSWISFSPRSRLQITLCFGMLIALVALAGCGTSSATAGGPINQPPAATATFTAPPATNTPSGPTAAVEIRSAGGGYGNYAFSPVSLTVKVGTTVVWTNATSAPHTVTTDTGAPVMIASDSIPTAGGTFSFTFTKPGTYHYHCSVHPNMTATIVVTS